MAVFHGSRIPEGSQVGTRSTGLELSRLNWAAAREGNFIDQVAMNLMPSNVWSWNSGRAGQVQSARSLRSTILNEAELLRSW